MGDVDAGRIGRLDLCAQFRLDGVRMGPSTLLRETAELPILLAP